MATARPDQLFRNLSAKIASIPMILTALVVFVGGTVWTITYSFPLHRRANLEAVIRVHGGLPRVVRPCLIVGTAISKRQLGLEPA